MTFEDVKVIGIGSLTLLIVFLTVGAIYASGTFDIWGIVRRYLVVKIADMSSGEAGTNDAVDNRSGARGAASDAGNLMRRHTHQVNDENDIENASPAESLVLRQLPRTELIVMLAVQRKDDGSYLWSSNEIKKFVPGTDGPIGEIIATVRGKKPADPPARSIRKGINGEWEPVR
jgi:hypothetical protein